MPQGIQATKRQREEALNNYQLKGFVLKQVSQDSKDELAGALEGLAAEVTADDKVALDKIDRTKGTKGASLLQWKGGTVSKRGATRDMNLESCLPEGRSKGLLLSKDYKILFPLMT